VTPGEADDLGDVVDRARDQHRPGLPGDDVFKSFRSVSFG
jgi:hypothetical protein